MGVSETRFDRVMIAGAPDAAAGALEIEVVCRLVFAGDFVAEV